MQTNYKNLTTFFDEVLDELPCQSDTKAYIVSVFTKYKKADFDLSKDSITLTFSQARNKQDFSTFQNIGDWIFFSKTLISPHLHYASEDYYTTIARLSYYSCYKLINKQWRLFEELADNFIVLEKETKNLFNKKTVISF